MSAVSSTVHQRFENTYTNKDETRDMVNIEIFPRSNFNMLSFDKELSRDIFLLDHQPALMKEKLTIQQSTTVANFFQNLKVKEIFPDDKVQSQINIDTKVKEQRLINTFLTNKKCPIPLCLHLKLLQSVSDNSLPITLAVNSCEPLETYTNFNSKNPSFTNKTNTKSYNTNKKRSLSSFIRLNSNKRIEFESKVNLNVCDIESSLKFIKSFKFRQWNSTAENLSSYFE